MAVATEKKAADARLLGDEAVTYLQLIVRAAQDLDAAKVERQIDKDVRRVPVAVEDPAALKRILTAFSARYEEGGYCQGLNFIAGLLLTVVEEEEAFWLVCLLVEDILPPGFYSTELHGSKAEVHVLTQLVTRYLPNINPLLARWSLTLEPFAFAWIMCLFVGELPLHLLLDVWDRLLVDGVTVLCRAALSLLRIHEKALTAADSMDDAMLTMQSHRVWAAGGPAPGTPARPTRSHEEGKEAPLCRSPSINGKEVHSEVYNTISFISALQLYDQVLPNHLEGIRRKALEQLLSVHRSVLLKESMLQLAKHNRALLKAVANDDAHTHERAEALRWSQTAAALAQLDDELSLRVTAIEAGLALPELNTDGTQRVDACGGYAVACRIRGPVFDAHAGVELFSKGARPALAATGDGAAGGASGAALPGYADTAVKPAQKVLSLLADLLDVIDQQRERAQPLSALSIRKARDAHRHDHVAKHLRAAARTASATEKPREQPRAFSASDWPVQIMSLADVLI